MYQHTFYKLCDTIACQQNIKYINSEPGSTNTMKQNMQLVTQIKKDIFEQIYVSNDQSISKWNWISF